jgi:hypothetical protein
VFFIADGIVKRVAPKVRFAEHEQLIHKEPRTLVRKLTLGLMLILICASSALGQTTRTEWVTARDKKDRQMDRARGAAGTSLSKERLAPQAVGGVLSLLSWRSFPDAFGDEVVVGEVQNVSGATLSFSRAIFDFYNGGVYVGSDYSYVFGSHNGRLALTGSYTAVLPPGAIGFFKVWTNLPYNGITNLVFQSDAETYALAPVYSTLQLGPISLAPNVLGGTNFAGTVRNPTGSFTTYFTLVALAGTFGGLINDVEFTFASGATVNLCGTSSTSAVGPGATAPYSDSFLRPVSAVTRTAVEWDEYGIVPAAQAFAATGGTATVAVIGNCVWNAVSQAPWITITSAPGGSGDGSLSFAVAANTGPARTGTLTIAGHTFTVTQASGVACNYTVQISTTTPLGTGGAGSAAVTAPATCEWSAASTASWLTITSGAIGSGSGTVGFSVQANATFATRSATLTIAGHAFTITQPPATFPRPGSFDFDHDGRADLGVYRHSTGEWFIARSTGGAQATPWGDPTLGDVPVPGDYDGDGVADIAIYRTTTGDWFVIRSSTSTLLQVNWGAPSLGDIPVPGDYDADGQTDVAVYRVSSGDWFVIRSSNSTLLQTTWGAPSLGDVPVPADYDGDGKTDVAVYRLTTGQWFVIRSSNSTLLQVGWGAPELGDVPVVGDYDDDGKADVAVYRQTTAQWFIIRSSNSTLLQVGWGVPSLGDIPVPADYDNDGKTDIGVFRGTTGEWFVIHSSTSTLFYQSWGAPALADRPFAYPR